MQIEKVQCLVRVTQNGQTNLTQIVLAGPDAIPVTEIPILRMINDINEGGEDDCCVTDVVGQGFIDTSKGNEIARLKQKYGQIVDTCYPGGRGLPILLIDCELPDHALKKVKAGTKPKTAEKVEA